MHQLFGSNGQSLVEFALIVPLMLLLLIGAIEIGRIAYFSIAVSNAARSAVQYGAQSPVTATYENFPFIRQEAVNDAPMLSLDNVTVKTFCECLNGDDAPTCDVDAECPGDERIVSYLQVNTQMQVMPLVRFPGLPPSFSLNGEAIMRIGQ